MERAGDIKSAYFKVLLFGDSGSGKTWMTSTAAEGDKLAYLLLEDNGLQTIRMANPDARVVRADSMNTVRAFFKSAVTGVLKKEGVTTIGLDGLTEVQRLLKDEILEKKPRGQRNMTLPDWGLLTNKMRNFMRMLRKLEFHLAATALADSQIIGETRRVVPLFEGKKLPNEVAQFFNAVGYVHREVMGYGDEGADDVRRVAMLEGPERFLVKPCAPLHGTIEGPVSKWFEAMASGEPLADPSSEYEGDTNGEDDSKSDEISSDDSY